MNKKIFPVVLLLMVLALAAGLGAGYWFASHKAGLRAVSVESAGAGGKKALFYRNPMNPAITSPVPAKDEMGMDYVPVYAEENGKTVKRKERKILFYRNPMNPAVTSPVPAKDEMGMDYVPVYAEEGGEDEGEPAGTVSIDPVTVQNIGVRTVTAGKQVLSRSIRAVGRVDYNEELISRVHPKIDGWIEKLFVDKTGEFVKKDDILLSIYSPQLVATQQEYLLALKNAATLKDSPFAEIRRGAEELVTSSLKRLEFFDVPAHQIEEITVERKVKKDLHIHAPAAGIVMHLGVSEGEYVTPGTELYMLADLSRVWVYVAVYENELPWLTLGDEAEMTVAAAPGRTFRGKVSFIYPYMERKTRTARVRLEFDNRDLALKPEMFANVVLRAGKKIEAVVIPSEAVVRSGNRDQVFIVRGQGKFEPREVRLGVASGGMTQVLAGVESGDKVVTSSQFLIDSESKLREATAKMMEKMAAGKTAAPGPAKDSGVDKGMSGMTMETPKGAETHD